MSTDESPNDIPNEVVLRIQCGYYLHQGRFRLPDRIQCGSHREATDERGAYCAVTNKDFGLDERVPDWCPMHPLRVKDVENG